MQRTYQLDAGRVRPEDAAALDTLVAAGVTRHFADGAFIQHEGDVADGIWVVLHGIVAVGHHSADGNFSMVVLGGPGDITGEMAYFGDMPRQFDAVARGNVTIASVNRHRLARLLESDVGVACLLLHSMARQLHLIAAMLEAERSQPARVRLAKLLLSQTSADRLIVAASQQDIAGLLGVSRVTMVSALTDLVGAGLVERGYRQVAVTDRHRLADWIGTQQELALS